MQIPYENRCTVLNIRGQLFFGLCKLLPEFMLIDIVFLTLLWGKYNWPSKVCCGKYFTNQVGVLLILGWLVTSSEPF